MQEIQEPSASAMVVTNYRKDGSTFLNCVRVYPLSSDSSNKITHLLGVLEDLTIRDHQGLTWSEEKVAL